MSIRDYNWRLDKQNLKIVYRLNLIINKYWLVYIDYKSKKIATKWLDLVGTKYEWKAKKNTLIKNRNSLYYNNYLYNRSKTKLNTSNIIKEYYE